MKKQEVNLDQIQEKVQKLRSELESQLNLLNNYVNDFELIEASEFYYKSKRGREKFIDFKELKFPFKKYFIEVTSGTFGRKVILNKEITKQINDLVNVTFNKENYVVVVCANDMGTSSENILKQLYELLKKQQVGKIIVAGRGDELEEGLVLSEVEQLANGREKISVNEVKYDVCVYEGVKLLNQNVILLGDEFGMQNCLTKIIVGLSPKSVLNILIGSNGNSFWHDNVD
ncbi:MAG: hypothetical protein JST26_08395 [Bacteroidetes bacterium]|nr:hypothetical protein [Bacteroidota bacterium]